MPEAVGHPATVDSRAEGNIWCGDGMEECRKGLIDRANELKADIVVLADHSKVGVAAPSPITQVDWADPRVWPFVDEVPDDQKELIAKYTELRNVLKQRLVRVPVGASSDESE